MEELREWVTSHTTTEVVDRIAAAETSAVASDDFLRGVLDFYGGLLPTTWQVAIKDLLVAHGTWAP